MSWSGASSLDGESAPLQLISELIITSLDRHIQAWQTLQDRLRWRSVIVYLRFRHSNDAAQASVAPRPAGSNSLPMPSPEVDKVNDYH